MTCPNTHSQTQQSDQNSSGFRSIFPLLPSDEPNPAFNAEYLDSLRVPPPLVSRVQKIISASLSGEYLPIADNELGTNAFVNANEVENTIFQIKELLFEAYRLNHGKPVIYIITDGCFTNNTYIERLSKILQEDFNRFVQIVPIDYEKGTITLDPSIFPEYSITMLGGSIQDTYSMKQEVLCGGVQEHIRSVLNDTKQHKFLIGICAGDQILRTTLNGILSTQPIRYANIKGHAQFGYFPGEIISPELMAPFHKEALRLMTNKTGPTKAAFFYTRTGWVKEILSGYEHDRGPFSVLARDTITGQPTIIGLKNMISASFHPELPATDESHIEAIREWLPSLRQHYGDTIDQILEYIKPGNIQSLHDPFYRGVELACLQRMYGRNETLQLYSNSSSPKNYNDGMRRLAEVIHQQRIKILRTQGSEGVGATFSRNRIELMRLLDEIGALRLNDIPDWKVARDLGQLVDVMGMDFVGYITDSIDYDEKLRIEKGGVDDATKEKLNTICDLGAGDGTGVQDIYDHLGKRNAIVYGVGDAAYCDLFRGLSHKKEVLEGIPIQVQVLFVEKVLAACQKNPKYRIQPIKKTLEEVLKTIVLSPDDPIHITSMFSPETHGFSMDGEIGLDEASKLFITSSEGKERISQLKSDIINDFYSLFTGFIERIFISNFQNLVIPDEGISQVDFQYSVRSTSHLNSEDYKEVVFRDIQTRLKPGAVFFDNGIHESYTSIPRLKELHEIQQHFGSEIRIRLVYEAKSNYFCSAIIEKAPFRDTIHPEKYLGNGKQIVSLDEAHQSTFFQFERALREFLASSLLDKNVFWYCNHEIMSYIQHITNNILKNEIGQSRFDISLLFYAIIPKMNNVIASRIVKKHLSKALDYDKAKNLIKSLVPDPKKSQTTSTPFSEGLLNEIFSSKDASNIVEEFSSLKYNSMPRDKILNHRSIEGGTSLEEMLNRPGYCPAWLNTNGQRFN